VQWTIGERFVPGSDDKHLCQPAGVAVARDGSVFVADGYCNSRVVKFSAEGKYLMEFGEESARMYLKVYVKCGQHY
jgi:peptidylamidoglycolate lyase